MRPRAVPNIVVAADDSALHLAVEGGWAMSQFVEDLQGKRGEDAQAVAEMFLSSGGFLLSANRCRRTTEKREHAPLSAHAFARPAPVPPRHRESFSR